MTRPLTASEQQTLDFITLYIAVHGWGLWDAVDEWCGLPAGVFGGERLMPDQPQPPRSHASTAPTPRAIQLLDTP